eukprot:snap_masked-scaffold425_size175135-processed-gene-0.8 protein:Tk05830 transcript:snap_masked-scaffold425_size175135-processed-gene-0.8-mRNA-1 annotation:"hypothetical protein BRAFLDRAFT_115040"
MDIPSKKLINVVPDAVIESLAGLVTAHPQLTLLTGLPVVLRADLAEVSGQVALVSGGGSGHEPAHGAFVGPGMLTAAVAGDVFTSPPVSSILATLRTVWRVGQPAGILLIVKNYTGDRINFGLAMERARAEGIEPCAMVVVADDCALASHDRSAGRRGLAGTVLVHKVAGALAAKGQRLSQIVDYLESHVLPRMATIGLSLTPCSLPGRGPSFELGEDQMELGLGIHGEAGVKRQRLGTSLDCVRQMINHMTDPQSATHLHIADHQSVIVLINNLGGTSNLEMGIVTQDLFKVAKARRWQINRLYVGPFMTALEMAGISITILNQDDGELLTHLDYPVSAPGWPRTPNCIPGPPQTIDPPEASRLAELPVAPAAQLANLGRSMAEKGIEFACEAVKSFESVLNTMDTGAGDGDCGSTLKRGAERLQRRARSEDIQSMSQIFGWISQIAENDMGGSAGAMYSILFATAEIPTRLKASPLDVAEAILDGLKGMMKCGGAEPGDRTMLDSLLPAFHTLQEALTRHPEAPLSALEKATIAAEEGAQATLAMKASAGRASYVAASELKHPDPGAHAAAVVLRAVYQAVLKVATESGLTDA